MRLARDYEHAEGRDLRGFISFAVTQDLAEAREGEAALESEGLDAVRLMTIHRAKGLEFPVVCVADLGRLGAGGRPRLLLGRERSGGEASGRDSQTVGLRLAVLGGGDPVPALAYDRLAAEEDRADAEEERRLLYVAMTRARERLILSGGADCERWPRAAARWRPAGLDRARDRRRPARPLRRRGGRSRRGAHLGRPRRACALPPQRARHRRRGAPRGRAGPRRTAPQRRARHRAARAAEGDAAAAGRGRGRRQQRLSYSALQAYARCGYRFYLQRVLGLAPEEPPPLPPEEAAGEETERLEARVRGSLVHALLEKLDFGRPEAPPAADVEALAKQFRIEVTADDVEDVRSLVGAFAASPLCERLAAAQRVRREAGFAFTLEPGGGGSLVNGFVDVIAAEHGGGRLVVDYKTDRLDGAEPADVIARDYETQRTVYALAALRDGAEHVDVAYCFLERPAEPVVRRFSATDAPALAERVVSLARGVLDEHYPVTDAPHRDLCADCPGRRALCSHPESRTLAKI